MKHIVTICCLLLLCLPAWGAVTLLQNADGTVTLAWDANSETDLAGYKVYWGTATRTYTNAPVPTVSVSANPTFITPKLPNGTWYFAVTAYNTGGLESGFSNEVSAVINVAPNPPTNLRLVQGPIASMIGKKEALIAWKTNVAADGEVSYNRIGFPATLVKNASLSTDHSFRLASLQPNQLWQYTIRSRIDQETVTATGSFWSR